MCVGPADAQRANASNARPRFVLPNLFFRDDEEGTLCELCVRVWCFEMEAGWNQSVANYIRGFYQTDHASGHIGVAHVRLNRSQRAKLFLVS